MRGWGSCTERRQRIRGAEDVRGCGVMKVRGGTVFLHGGTGIVFLHGGTGCRGEGAAGVMG